MQNHRKYSRKRQAVLAAIRSTDSHPSAEWVYARLKPELPDLSLATVYRNIAMFKQDGDIVSVAVVGGQERFDGDTSAHDHFICERCGAVLDIPADPALPPIDSLSLPQGAEVLRRSVTYYGRCPGCAE